MPSALLKLKKTPKYSFKIKNQPFERVDGGIHPLTEQDYIILDYFGNELGQSIAARLLFVTY